jgi:hypothetical protein
MVIHTHIYTPYIPLQISKIKLASIIIKDKTHNWMRDKSFDFINSMSIHLICKNCKLIAHEEDNNIISHNDFASLSCNEIILKSILE